MGSGIWVIQFSVRGLGFRIRACGLGFGLQSPGYITTRFRI